MGEGGRDSEPERGRRPPAGPLESLLYEAIRRATGLGLSGLATTEEAVRKAVGDHLPPEWGQFLSDQSGELRSQLADRLAAEFGQFLRSPELDEKLGRLLEKYEVRVSFTLSTEPRKPASDVQVDLSRRKT